MSFPTDHVIPGSRNCRQIPVRPPVRPSVVVGRGTGRGRGFRQVPGDCRYSRIYHRTNNIYPTPSYSVSGPAVRTYTVHRGSRVSGSPSRAVTVAMIVLGVASAIFGACILPFNPASGLVFGGAGILMALAGTLGYSLLK